ncbi:MAG: cyclic nucleotide-binding domain-containing protein [Actinomycetota bacterium]|nr:cyclic nucleotide-binding domain-containing protein [Actinomycetota bacterium]
MTIDDLRALPLFADVSDAGLERLAECVAELERDPGQVIALPGDPGSGMFVIREGTVLVELRGDAPIELKDGNFFGELALLTPQATRIGRVRAASKVRLLSIPREEALALVESEPSVALRMLKEIARRFAGVPLDT